MIRFKSLILSLLMSVTGFSGFAFAQNKPDSQIGTGIHPKDFQVFDLNGRLLFVDDRAVLSLIGNFEASSGYDTVYLKSKIRPPKPITQMTISEVVDWQRSSKNAGSASTAAGVYQFIMTSLIDTAKKAGISQSEKFDRFTQDRMARSVLRNCGFYRHDVPDTVIGDCLAGTWAALPLITGPKAGSSRYAGIAGNKSLTSTDSVIQTIKGRFRDIAFAGEIRNSPGAVSVQKITPSAQMATLKSERSSATGEFVFSVSPPSPEQIEKERRERYTLSLQQRAQELMPFNGYVKKTSNPPRNTQRTTSIPVIKNDGKTKKNY